MPKCGNTGCSEDLAPGWSYCSSECSSALAVTKAQEAIQPDNDSSKTILTVLDDPNYISAYELGARLGVNPVTIYNWAERGKIPFVAITPKRKKFHFEEVKKALADQSERQVREAPARVMPEAVQVPKPEIPKPEPKGESLNVETPKRHTSLDFADWNLDEAKRVRRDALKIAHSVYCDVILEEAERAEKIGNIHLAFQLLRDHIQIGNQILELGEKR